MEQNESYLRLCFHVSPNCITCNWDWDYPDLLGQKPLDLSSVAIVQNIREAK